MKQKFINQKLRFVEEIIVHTDAHVFLTGKAGTGKTTFLKSLPSKTAKRMVVVAPTGVAAINAGGQTIHSFFQLPFGPQIPEKAQQTVDKPDFRARALASQFQKISRNKMKIMRGIELLIIDEISMVRADVLDAVDAVLRRARRSSKPFGGVQLLMIGDVHQLAPVAKPDEWEVLAPYYDTPYFFGSHVLQKAPYLCVELEHIYRQHDLEFINLLNKVRHNKMDDECIAILNSRYMPDFAPSDDEGYITLTTHNYQADDINERKLRALHTESLTFQAEITGTFPENIYPTRETLELKVGAQVMFIKNDPNPEKAYYNGKIGRLIGYDKQEGTLEVLCGTEHITVSKIKWQNMEYMMNNETLQVEEAEIGSFTQIPLRLAWAVTIHKSQGLTFDKLIVDAGQAFAHGQVYVALSRCTSLQGLVLKTRLSPSVLVSDYRVESFADQMPEREPTREKVTMLRRQFETETMLDLINFQPLYSYLGRLSSIVIAHKNLYEKELIPHLMGRMEMLDRDVCAVSKKFVHQLHQLSQTPVLCADNSPLQERLMKAAVYFKEHLDTVFSGLFDLPLKTDNKSVNEQITESLKMLHEAYTIKKSCLEACKKGFSAEEYQITKSTALLKAEKKENQPVSIKDSTMDKSSLYAALVSWRDELADEEDALSYNIVLNRTLKEISRERPLSMRKLKEIDGMGQKRIKLYGAEILAIVQQFSDNPASHADSYPDNPIRMKKGSTYRVTKEMIEQGLSVEEIAQKRGMAASTVYGHIAQLVGQGDFDAKRFVEETKYATIMEYFDSADDAKLSSAKDVLGDEYEFWELRTVLAERQRGE